MSAPSPPPQHPHVHENSDDAGARAGPESFEAEAAYVDAGAAFFLHEWRSRQENWEGGQERGSERPRPARGSAAAADWLRPAQPAPIREAGESEHATGTDRYRNNSTGRGALSAGESENDQTPPVVFTVRPERLNTFLRPTGDQVAPIIVGAKAHFDGDDAAVGWPDEVDAFESVDPLFFHRALAQRPTFVSAEMIQDILWSDPKVVRRKDDKGQLILHVASRYASLPVVQALVDACPKALEVRDGWGQLPLHHAAAYNESVEVVHCLAERCPKGLEVKDKSMQLPLHRAADNNSVDVVLCLVARCPKALEVKDRWGQLPLHRAAAYNESVEVVQCLAERCPKGLEVKDDWGQLPLHRAADNNSVEVAECLAALRFPAAQEAEIIVGQGPLHRTDQLPVSPLQSESQGGTNTIGQANSGFFSGVPVLLSQSGKESNLSMLDRIALELMAAHSLVRDSAPAPSGSKMACVSMHQSTQLLSERTSVCPEGSNVLKASLFSAPLSDRRESLLTGNLQSSASSLSAQPHVNDVVFGTGGRPIDHTGNQLYRDTIALHKESWEEADSNRDKADVADSVLQVIQSQDPKGRFLEFDPEHGLWREVERERVQYKIRRYLRKICRAEAGTETTSKCNVATMVISVPVATENDFLVGKGASAMNHTANVLMRRLVSNHAREYNETPRGHKNEFLRKIIDEWRSLLGGLFLKRNLPAGDWREIHETEAVTIVQKMMLLELKPFKLRPSALALSKDKSLRSPSPGAQHGAAEASLQLQLKDPPTPM